MLNRLTRLLWRRSANLTAQPVVRCEALAAVGELNQEGEGSVWRLPTINDQRSTINELESLVDCAVRSHAKDENDG